MQFLHTTIKHWLTVMFLSLGLMLGGCSQEDLDAITESIDTADAPPPSSSTATLSGTAATGAAIVGYIVVADANGQTIDNVVINADGRFSADVTNMTPPFILKAIADDPTIPAQYSYTAATNVTVNITPLTSLAMFIANGKQDLSSFANNWVSENHQITESALETAKAQINSVFSTQYQEQGINPNTYDFFSTPFAADHTRFDAVLDSLSINIDMTGGSFSVKVNNIPFDFISGDTNSEQASTDTSVPSSETADSELDDSTPNSDTSTSDIPDTGDVLDSDAGDDTSDSTANLDTSWELTITGTVTTSGFQSEVAEVTTLNLSMPDTTDDIESEIIHAYAYGTVEGDVMIEVIAEEDDLIIYEVSFDSTGMSYILLYTYTKLDN